MPWSAAILASVSLVKGQAAAITAFKWHGGLGAEPPESQGVWGAQAPRIAGGPGGVDPQNARGPGGAASWDGGVQGGGSPTA